MSHLGHIDLTSLVCVTKRLDTRHHFGHLQNHIWAHTWSDICYMSRFGHIDIHTHIYKQTNKLIYIHIHSGIYTLTYYTQYSHMHTHSHTNTHTHTNTHKYTLTYSHSHTTIYYTYTHRNTHTYMLSYTLTYKHTCCTHNGRLIVHAVIHQMAGATGPRSYTSVFSEPVSHACVYKQ